MVRCEVYGRGWGTRAVLSVQGERITDDVWIKGNGQRYSRKVAKKHEVTQQEALAVAQNARTLIIGTGCLGKVKVSPTVLSDLSSEGIDYIVASTPEAVIHFNNANEPRAAIFHVHC